MIIIYITAIALSILLIGWTSSHLKKYDRKQKIRFLLIGIVIILLITVIIVLANGPAIENKEKLRMIYITNILIFTPLNSLFILPVVANTFNKYKSDIIKKEQLQKRLLIFIVIFIILLIFEVGYIQSLNNMYL